MKNNKLYCCYSVPQKEYLNKNGVKYEICALNPNTKCTMWVYIKTKKLNNLLKEWTLGDKPKV